MAFGSLTPAGLTQASGDLPDRSAARTTFDAMSCPGSADRSVRAALGHMGCGLWRFANHRRQRRGRIEYHHQPACGAAVGVDYRLSPSTLVGFALAGGGTNFAVASGLEADVPHLFQAGAFIRQRQGRVYFSAALAYGWQDVTTERSVLDARPIARQL